MNAQRLGLRLAQRAALNSRSQFLRQPTNLQMRLSSDLPKLEGNANNAFNRARAGTKAHAQSTTDLWRKLSIYAVIPALLLASINAWNLWTEHWEHWEHEAHENPREQRPEYAYMNVRNKKYPWGDGDKTLFWNDKVNYHKAAHEDEE